MSAFPGVTDMIGPQTSAWREAYQSLFGQWRTRPDLPENFWRDGRVRRRMYDAASVDPGLARADLAVAVEVVVESGLASGVRSDTETVAVIGFGDASMTIRSRGTRHDAYRVLERFEEELRAYITRKLSEKCGPDCSQITRRRQRRRRCHAHSQTGSRARGGLDATDQLYRTRSSVIDHPGPQKLG